MKGQKKLIIILGPTAVGKTDFSIEQALKYNSPIISCDSRQIYKEMSIGTAVPSLEQLNAVKHYFIQDRSVNDLFTVGDYEAEAIALIENLFANGHDTLVMSGGTGLYINAVCDGLDDMPEVDPKIRQELTSRLELEGPEKLAEELRQVDQESYESIELQNGRRVIRALEVFLSTGKPLSYFKTGHKKQRNFVVEKIGLRRNREELYDRINKRVEMMVEAGLVDEARALIQYKNLPALQTVGYKEIFSFLEGEYPLEEAIRLIQRNTRHYAKRQLTWWRRDEQIRWMDI